jgi:hypothetical protein
MTKQFGGNNYPIFMIAAAVVRQPKKKHSAQNEHIDFTLMLYRK